ncbi:MAG: hypothetical protein RBT55_17115, partial [Rhodocyclaceae bacterium]|nr:hypothetical protein [Rhodocyclaceae bacterium]
MNNKVERWLDARGRLWRQQAYAGASLESTAQFVFDTLKRGLPSSESISGSAGSQSRSYGYDGLARPIRRDSTMDGRTYREETRYDSYGRAWKTRDASGGWLKQQFDTQGFATRLCDSTEADTAPSCGTSFHTTVDEVDARGAVLVERRGSSVGPTIARSYNALNGQLVGVCTGPGCTVQNSAYGYDNKGQLTSREEAGRYKERFQYDGADRLTLGWFEYLGTTWYSASAPYVNPDAAAPANLSFYAQYDKLGNICRKYQFGLFAQYGYAGRAGCGTAGNPGSGSASSTLSAHQTQSLFIPGLITIANQHDARGNMTSADSLRFYAYNAL